MKFHTEYLTFNTKKHREYIHLTPQSRSFGRGGGRQYGEFDPPAPYGLRRAGGQRPKRVVIKVMGE